MFGLFVMNLIFASSNVYSAEFNLFGEAGQAYSLEVNLGHPPQKLNVLVDTGSTTLAVASEPRRDCNKYFNSEISTSVCNIGKQVQAKYSQGMWEGRLVSDFVQFPSIPSIPEVRSHLALITKSEKFFMDGSGWQGLLGLAYPPVGASGDNIVVGSWLDSVDRTRSKPISFQMKLCGVIGVKNATHYGNFGVLDGHMENENKNRMFRTPILRERWYEVGVISISVISPNTSNGVDTKVILDRRNVNEDMCRKLNEEKSIVDSGTTNIRLPDALFRLVVDELSNAALNANVILHEFWYNGEAACWPEPQQWSLPSIAIDLLSVDSDQQYFTLVVPPKNYMRVVSADNSRNGTVATFCYKLGLEAGGKETVLGYTAMEGFQVLFNRSGGWIGWQTSNCGPNSISGPYNTTVSLSQFCELTKPPPDVAISIRAAQWILCALSIIAGSVLVYLLAPCVKTMLVRKLRTTPPMSLSQAALVEQEST